MTDASPTTDAAPLPAPRASLWRIGGWTLLAVLVVIGLEGAALLAPAPLGLGVAVAALALGAVALASPRAAALRGHLRLDEPPPSAARLAPGVVLVALFVLSSLLLLKEASKTIDVPMLSRILGDRSAANRLRLVAVIVFLGPIGEELALRGWLQRHLEHRWGAALAVPVTGLFFGMLHGVDVRIAYFVALGTMFGAAAIAFRSLWAPIALHMSVNAMGAIPLLLGTPTPPPDAAGRAPSAWWGALGVACVLALFPGWLRRARLGTPDPAAGAL